MVSCYVSLFPFDWFPLKFVISPLPVYLWRVMDTGRTEDKWGTATQKLGQPQTIRRCSWSNIYWYSFTYLIKAFVCYGMPSQTKSCAMFQHLQSCDKRLNHITAQQKHSHTCSNTRFFLRSCRPRRQTALPGHKNISWISYSASRSHRVV